MAIVINGSGTVTGISVGGLPDDIVDAGTLADDAVGLAQMASGTDGNIITYDASGNPAVVATGSAGQILTSAGAGAAPTMAAGGKLLQVVQGTSETQLHSTSASDDLISQAITPTATSSSVLIHVTLYFGVHNPNGGITCFRDSTAVGATTTQYHSSVGSFWGADDFISRGGTSTHNNDYTILPLNWTFLDTGISTTSATTYKFSTSSYSEVSFNRAMNGTGSGNSRSTITLMEIAG